MDDLQLKPGDISHTEKALSMAIASLAEKKPGTYAVSATYLRGVYLINKKAFQYFWNKEPVAKIGYSIFIYRIP